MLFRSDKEDTSAIEDGLVINLDSNQKEETKFIKTMFLSYDISSRESFAEINTKLRELFERDPVTKCYICKVCGKVKTHSGHMTDHVEFHVEGLRGKCDHCEKVFHTRTALRSHT